MIIFKCKYGEIIHNLKYHNHSKNLKDNLSNSNHVNLDKDINCNNIKINKKS